MMRKHETLKWREAQVPEMCWSHHSELPGQCFQLSKLFSLFEFLRKKKIALCHTYPLSPSNQASHTNFDNPISSNEGKKRRERGRDIERGILITSFKCLKVDKRDKKNNMPQIWLLVLGFVVISHQGYIFIFLSSFLHYLPLLPSLGLWPRAGMR